MNRRGFFGRMIGAVVALGVAPKAIETPSTEDAGHYYDYSRKSYPPDMTITVTENVYFFSADGPYVNDGRGSGWKRL